MKKIIRLSSLLLVLVGLLGLTACAPKDPVKAKEKLEKAEYTVEVDGTVMPGVLKLAGIDGIESVVIGSKKVDDKLETVTAILFAEKAQAKDAIEALEAYANKQGEESEVKQAGKWLYYGTEQGMKDFN